MRRATISLLVALLTGWTVQAYAQGYGAQSEKNTITMVTLTGADGQPFVVPPSYGRLNDVVVNNDIHYLYFVDADGVIRIVLVGPRGSSQKARNAFDMVAPRVYVIDRKASTDDS